MSPTEILELVRAGYTKVEIEAMAPEPDPAPTPEPDPAPTLEPDLAPTPDRLAQLEQSIVRLTQAVQSSNIINSGGGIPALTAEDALASLIKKGG